MAVSGGDGLSSGGRGREGREGEEFQREGKDQGGSGVSRRPSRTGKEAGGGGETWPRSADAGKQQLLLTGA